MDPRDFLELVIRPTLAFLELGGAPAERLLLATAVHESGGLRALQERGGGPGLGVYQIKPATHHDVLTRWLAYRHDLEDKIGRLITVWPDRERQLVGNLPYATAIARCIYRRAPGRLPAPDDIEGQARYWKRHFNTVLGLGTPEAFVESWKTWGLR